ncbi:hypothetical protein TAMA11512_11430 [Selenomonas sp. TAMA-11512]|uniref:hypothetical protein n=1 Tax=Selenomonas sp. TAMA-11512 TaxID=3095337 RepID=UPI00308550E6|nr:hypothetical protein TAMA11512_11430 [Selenomonas sp. TAMA-11512]
MVESAEKFKKFLKENKIDSYQSESLRDKHKSVIFRSTIEVEGQFVPIGVIFDDTIYVIVRANLAPKALNDQNAYAIERFLMRLNNSSKLFKYYLAPDTSIILDACIPMLEENFSSELVHTIVGVVAKEVETRHKELMQLVWSAH